MKCFRSHCILYNTCSVTQGTPERHPCLRDLYSVPQVMNAFSFTDAPVLKLEVPSQVQEGHSVQFKCILLGAMPSALSLVTWKKDGVDIESLYQSLPLEIRSVAVSDAGVYTCSRSNSVGVGESPPVSFHVNCKYYTVGLSLRSSATFTLQTFNEPTFKSNVLG